MKPLIALDPYRGTIDQQAVVTMPKWENSQTTKSPQLDQAPETQNDRGWIVTVFDNDHNTVLEVASILMVATGCDAEEASIETWEIHHLGKSIVHRHSQKECERAAQTIATIGIKVIAEKDPLA
jgi:ATP-dependent Clp protease adapter protein ClpS